MCRKTYFIKRILLSAVLAGITGPLIGIYDVTGKGLAGTVTIDPPKLPEPVPVTTRPYQLR
jgi:hypothetical protein